MKSSIRRTLSIVALGICALAAYGGAQQSAQLSRPASSFCTGGSERGMTAVHAAAHRVAGLSLCDGVALETHFSAGSEGGSSLENARPLALASGDFDEDGMPDLVSGFAAGNGGTITVHRGNVNALWGYGEALRNGPPPPFLADARTFDVPEAPEFLVAGDFNADGHWDVVTAHLGSNSLYLLRGDGHGGFSAAERIQLPGAVTAMIAGEINRADGLTDLIVGVKNAGGAQVLVFESPLGALRGQPESFTVARPVTALALGHFDGGAMNDLAVGAGNQIYVIHGRDRMLSLSQEHRAQVAAARVTVQNFLYAIQALAAGDFTGTGPSIAALGPDGNVHILDHALAATALGAQTLEKMSDPNFLPSFEAAKPGPNGKPMIVNGHRTPELEARIAALRVALKTGGHGTEWTERSVVALPSGFAQAIPRLVAARVAGSSREEILVADSGNSKLHILSTRTSAKKMTTLARAGVVPAPEQMHLLASLEAESAPAAVLPMRLSRQGLSGVVMLQAGQAEPTVIAQDIPASNIFTVTNTQDAILAATQPTQYTGPAGSLRAAINNANNASGPALIQFDIPTTDPGYNPATGTWKIQPLSTGTQAELLGFALDYIGNTVTIDGYSQPGASPNTSTTADNAKILIQIDGGAATTPGNDGLEPFDDSGTVIRGIAFTGWTNAYNSGGGSSGACGVEALGSGDFIEGNFLGVDTTGKNAAANRIGVFADGGIKNVIGGTTPQARNILSGNNLAGALVLVGVVETTVEGNFIGTDITGAAALSNLTDGVGTNGSQVSFGGPIPGAGNLISGNPTNVDLNDLTDENGAANSFVQGNLIGTDGTATHAQTFGGTGVSILNNPTYMTIGGTTPTARNVISGNVTGVYVFNNSNFNIVQGNYIGTDITGTVALPNLTYGYESGSVAETTDGTAGTDTPSVLNNIGGAVQGAGNVISGNGQDAINISGTTQYPAGYGYLVGNTIQGNFIGTDYTGTQPIPNQGNGVYLLSGATNNLIGGTEPGAGNLIAYNKQNGVLIDPGTGTAGPGTGNQTIANTILSNVGAGVRINTGTQDRISKNSIFGNGTLGINLDGLGPNLNTNCNATTTGPNNQENAPVLTAGTGAAFISATATDPNGNTSEFSNSVAESLSGNVLDLLGTFNGLANTAYTIEFFSSPSDDTSGYGQGQTYIGSTTVTTNGSCTAPVSDPVNLTQADVSVTLTDNSFGLQAGADFGQESYTGTITNNGPATAHNVVFQDVLPAGLTISGPNCNLGACQSPVTTSFGSCTVSGNTVTCNVGTLPPGTTSTVNIPVAVTATASGSITNTATVSATEVDPVLANNTSSVTGAVTYPSALIDRLVPNAALVNSPSDLVVTIYGNGLLPNSAVTFNGNAVSNLAYLDNQGCGFEQGQYCPALQVLVPASMLTTAGTPNLVVTNPNPAPYGYTDYPASATFTIAPSCTFTFFSLLPTLPATIDSGGTDYAAGAFEVYVTASAPTCPWTATSSVPWAAVLDNASATGSQTVDIGVGPNTDPVNSRSGVITIAGQSYDIQQDAGASCGFQLSPSSASFTTAGGTGSINVTSTCNVYGVASYAPWITIPQSDGFLGGNSTVTYTVAPNTGAPLSGYIEIAEQPFQITQAAPSCYYTLSANSTTLPIGGGTGSVSVTPSSPTCAWTAKTPSPSPITITSGASGTGNGTVSFSAVANTGGALTSNITIGDQNGGSSIFAVNQPSAYSCTFTLAPAPSSGNITVSSSGVNISADGTANYFTITPSYQSCTWNASSSDPTALTLPNSSSGTGTGTVYYAVGQNTGAARTLTITAGCQTFTINQAGTETVNNPTPAITTLSPSSATAGTAAFTLTVNGTGFINGSVVNFNGSARTTTFVSATQLTAALLASDIASAGTPAVTVTNPTPGGGTSNSVTFNVTAANNPVPAITALSPSSATAGSAAFALTVSGTGFINGSVVNFNGSPRTTTFVSATQLTAALLASDIASVGTPAVTVTNPTPGGGTSNSVTFNVTAANNPVPAITALSPTSVTAGASAFTLTVNGSGFVNGAVVNFNGSARTTSYVSATQLTAAILASDVATVWQPSVTVTNPTPGGGTSNSLTFVVSTPLTASVTLTPSSLTFSAVTGTTSTVQPVTLQNTGTASLSLSSIAITGTNPSDFSETNNCGSSVAAGASCTISVSFTPSSAASFTATLSVTDTGSAAAPSAVGGARWALPEATATSTQTVALSGTGTAATAPAVSLTPASLSFTAVTGTTSATQPVTLQNTGNTALTLSGITLTGTNPSDFSQTNNCGSSLTASASCTISVTFTPASAASFSATLSVADNVSGSPQTVTLSGTGTAAPSFTVSSSGIPQIVQPGGSASYTLTVTPVNGSFANAVTFAASGLPTGATASFSPASVTPGSSPATSTLTIQTAPATASAAGSSWPLAAPVLAFVGLLFLPGKRRRRWITAAVLVCVSLTAFTALTGCGGGFALNQQSKSQSQSQTYTVTVTATSGSVQQSTTVQLTVQ